MIKMKTGEKGIALIKHFEGFSSTVYLCPASKPTIGYGHLVRQHEVSLFDGRVMSDKEATVLLHEDLLRFEEGVHRYVTVPLTQNQFDALVCFTYNLGCSALKRSTLRRLLNLGDYAGVPEQLNRWNKASGHVLWGLVLRRKAEGELFNG